uniref:ribonuclease H n=1 Tax=Latimeria chalumnae TaxID=7897 RepID=H3B9C4_LATCH
QGILQVAVYLDDILVTGLTEVEHLENLEEILNRLEKAGLCLKRSKCTFKAKEVVFLGHKVDATGLHPVKEEVQAIQEAPATKLKSYLGLLNDYNRFLPNLSALLMPLQLPLQKYVKWYWGCVQEKAFEASKTKGLAHYDEDKELILSCDASPYGIGTVLSHRMKDGLDRPIGFVSRALTVAELDKEGLAVIFGVQKFHNYIYGTRFT